MAKKYAFLTKKGLVGARAGEEGGRFDKIVIVFQQFKIYSNKNDIMQRMRLGYA